MRWSWLVGPDPRAEGEEPDARFSYANERTFLAWNRTALALIGVGLAVANLLPPFNFAGGRRLLALPLDRARRHRLDRVAPRVGSERAGHAH